jgi:hypothetical protein
LIYRAFLGEPAENHGFAALFRRRVLRGYRSGKESHHVATCLAATARHARAPTPALATPLPAASARFARVFPITSIYRQIYLCLQIYACKFMLAKASFFWRIFEL